MIQLICIGGACFGTYKFFTDKPGHVQVLNKRIPKKLINIFIVISSLFLCIGMQFASVQKIVHASIKTACRISIIAIAAIIMLECIGTICSNCLQRK